MDNSVFPAIKKSIADFISDQDGNIPRNRLLTIGSMVLVMGIIFAQDVFAGHRSHSSHSSHKSHSSHSSHSSHASHSNTHASHASHSNTHASHASHSNTHSSHASHSNTHSSHSNMPTVPGINTPRSNPGNVSMPNLSGAAPAMVASRPIEIQDSAPKVQVTKDTFNEF